MIDAFLEMYRQRVIFAPVVVRLIVVVWVAPAARPKWDVRFSNRPVRVKRFQTIHRCSVDVARGLVLLFGIGTKAFPSWDSRTRRNNLLVGLAVEEQRVQADIRTHLIHRPARDIFPPLGGALVFSYRV